MIIDGDSSWFNNPQYRISCGNTPARITLSLIPVSLGEEAEESGQGGSSLPLVQLTVAELPRGAASQEHEAPFIGDSLLCNVVATDKAEGVFRQKGLEASIWNLRLAANKHYFVIPSTSRRGQSCEYSCCCCCCLCYTASHIPILKLIFFHLFRRICSSSFLFFSHNPGKGSFAVHAVQGWRVG